MKQHIEIEIEMEKEREGMSCSHARPNDSVEAYLKASLLVGTSTSTSTSTSTTSKYLRLWRLTFYVRIFIFRTRTATTQASDQLRTPLLAPTTSSSLNHAIHVDVDQLQEQEQEQLFKNDIARIVKARDLPSLLALGGPHRVRSLLTSSPSQGGNHQVLENTDNVDGGSLLYCFVNSCKRNGYTMILLMISAMLCLATEIKQEGPKYGWHDTAAIVVAMIMILFFSTLSSFWHERKKNRRMKFKVFRCEAPIMVAIDDILVGDIVCLKMGEHAPADGLILNNDNETHDPFLLFNSKVLLEGETRMLVTSSLRSEISVEMQTSAANKREKNMPLESRIERPISIIDRVALFISALVMLVVLIRLLSKKDGDNSGLPEIKGQVSVDLLIKLMERIFLKPQGKVSILTSLVALALISIQHGVPLMVTISLQYQMDKVVSNQVADLHDLSSCVTMGLVTIICVDPSGLMSKPMEVSRIRIGERDISNDVMSEINQELLHKIQQGAGVSVLSPLSNSLISWVETTWGLNRESLGQNLSILEHSRQNCMGDGNGVLVKKVGDHERDMHSHWSGAASTILEMCSHYYDSNGEFHVIANQKIEFGKVIKEMEDSGLEPIALAYQKTNAHELQQDGLILLVLIGLKHSCLEETKKALAHLKSNGIKIKLVSEQDIEAVKAFACELGIEISVEDGFILEGKEIHGLDSTEVRSKLDKALVIGGFLPHDKVLMIKCLKEEGHVVAFFGGLTVSDAAVRAAADIVIDVKSQNPKSDWEISNISVKCFSAITTLVRNGRCQYDNIQKFIQLQLTASLSGLFITLITTMCTGNSPLSTIQLIWVNVIMCILGGIMMLMNLNIKEDQHASQPNNRNQSLITQEIWKDIVIDVLYQASVSLIFLFGRGGRDSTEQVRKTMIFNSFMLCQVFNQLNVLDLVKKGFYEMALLRYCFLVALGSCLILQVLIIQYANSLADCMSLSPSQWLICIVVSALSLVVEWPLKKILTCIFHHFHPCTV